MTGAPSTVAGRSPAQRLISRASSSAGNAASAAARKPRSRRSSVFNERSPLISVAPMTTRLSGSMRISRPSGFSGGPGGASWVRVQAGKTVDRRGKPLTITLKGDVDILGLGNLLQLLSMNRREGILTLAHAEDLRNALAVITGDTSGVTEAAVRLRQPSGGWTRTYFRTSAGATRFNRSGAAFDLSGSKSAGPNAAIAEARLKDAIDRRFLRRRDRGGTQPNEAERGEGL